MSAEGAALSDTCLDHNAGPSDLTLSVRPSLHGLTAVAIQWRRFAPQVGNCLSRFRLDGSISSRPHGLRV